jgi:tetratricopeptide (TPR) repeat protein
MLVTSSLAVVAMDARHTATEQRRQAEGLVGFMLGDLRDKLEPLGRLDVLDSVGSRALEYYQKQDKSELSDEALAQRSKALTLMGEVANARGDLTGALKHYQEALASTAETLRRYPDDPQRLFDHAQNVYWVGYIAYQRGQVGEAWNRFNQYRRLANRMVALAPANKDYQLEEMYANSNLGTVHMDERRYAQATVAFEATLRPAESLASAEPRNLDYQKHLGEALAWLADAYEMSGEVEKALAERERGLRLLSAHLRQHPRDTYLQRMIMTTYGAIGRLHGARGQVASGIQESLRGVAISETLFQIEPDNTEWLQASAAGRLDLAELQLAAGKPTDASASTRAACGIADRLLQRDSTVAEWKGSLRARCMILRARVAHEQEAHDEAVRLVRQALAAAAGSPKPLDRQILTMLALSVGSSALRAAGRPAEAVDWARKGVAAAPDRSQLIPRELVELAALARTAGNAAEAQRIGARLDSIGYRHPDYIRTRSGVGRA